jgi:glyoxylase-like metal-dependent hydrolase (beta-lactamase superfamily II)
MEQSGNETAHVSAVHWKVGGLVITSLSDGYFQMPIEQFVVGISPAEIETAQRTSLRKGNQRIGINSYLIRGKDRIPVLLDAGLGKGMISTAGNLSEALQSVGVSVDDIKTILLTHLHADHCRGLIDASGRAIYPNATVLVPAAEVAYWFETEAADKDAAALARAALKPYEGQIKLIEPGEVLPGVSAVALTGHTPGHTGYQFEDGGDSILVWGDVVNVPDVQSMFPQAGVATDVDPLQAIKTRLEIFEKAVQERLLIAGMHTEFPGIARLVRDDDRFKFEAASWIDKGEGL